MRFGFSHKRRRKFYWQATHIWALVRLHKRVVLAPVIYCSLFGVGLALATPYVYRAKVTLRVDKTDWEMGSFLETGR